MVEHMSDRAPLRPERRWRALIVAIAAVVSLPALPYVLFVTGFFPVPLVLLALAGAVRYVLGPITSILPRTGHD
jgi:hypothetical protein